MTAREDASLSGRLDCSSHVGASASLERRQFARIWNPASVGPQGDVLDDVGVRFGGSEHHRDSDPAPRFRATLPLGAGLPVPSGAGRLTSPVALTSSLRSRGGRQRRDGGLLSSEGDRHGRSHPVSAGNERCCVGFGRARCRAEVGNGKRATAAVMRYGCWRGKSSKGVNRVAGNANGDQSRLRAALVPGRRKRGEPLAGCGVQQTRDFYVEQAVMVVRNHEGGT